MNYCDKMIEQLKEIDNTKDWRIESNNAFLYNIFYVSTDGIRVYPFGTIPRAMCEIELLISGMKGMKTINQLDNIQNQNKPKKIKMKFLITADVSKLVEVEVDDARIRYSNAVEIAKCKFMSEFGDVKVNNVGYMLMK